MCLHALGPCKDVPMRGNEAVLISARHSGGVAAVVRRAIDGDEPTLWLTGMLTSCSAQKLDDHRAVQVELPAEQTAVAGLLPQGATGAEVAGRDGARHIAECRDGAWLVVLDQPISPEATPVRFEDLNGSTVRPHCPASWRRTPILDADETCPACGAAAWDQLSPTAVSHDGDPTVAERFCPAPLAVCSACGYEASSGYSLSASANCQRMPPRELERLQQIQREHLHRVKMALQSVDFPVYTLSGWTPRLGGCQGRAQGALSIELLHSRGRLGSGGLVTIVSARDPQRRVSERELARDALSCVIGTDEDWPERSVPGRAIWLRTRAREREALAARAEVRAQRVRVAGTAAPFSIVEAAGWWAAARVVREHSTTITANGISPAHLALVVADDLAPLIASSFLAGAA